MGAVLTLGDLATVAQLPLYLLTRPEKLDWKREEFTKADCQDNHGGNGTLSPHSPHLEEEGVTHWQPPGPSPETP